MTMLDLLKLFGIPAVMLTEENHERNTGSPLVSLGLLATCL